MAMCPRQNMFSVASPQMGLVVDFGQKALTSVKRTRTIARASRPTCSTLLRAGLPLSILVQLMKIRLLGVEKASKHRTLVSDAVLISSSIQRPRVLRSWIGVNPSSRKMLVVYSCQQPAEMIRFWCNVTEAFILHTLVSSVAGIVSGTHPHLVLKTDETIRFRPQ